MMQSKKDLRIWESHMAGWVRVTGEDAADYLQSQFSNDLHRPEKNPVTYGLFLGLKGKVRADAFVCQRGPECFEVISYHSTSENLEILLEENVIADEVYFEKQDFAKWVVIAGGNGWENGPEFPLKGCFSDTGGFLSFHGRWMSEEHFDVLVPSCFVSEWENVFYSFEKLKHLRVQSGRPSVPTDVGLGDLPQEGGLEHDAVSFNKGCYLGQEVMARLKAMGRVQRRLFRAEGSGSAPAYGDTILCGEDVAGEVRSSSGFPNLNGWIAIVMLRRRFAEMAESGPWYLKDGSGLTITDII